MAMRLSLTMTLLALSADLTQRLAPERLYNCADENLFSTTATTSRRLRFVVKVFNRVVYKNAS